jgi:hypothetical protein
MTKLLIASSNAVRIAAPSFLDTGLIGFDPINQSPDVAAVVSPRLLKLAWPARCTVPVPVPRGVESARASFHSLRAGKVGPSNYLKSLETWKFLTNIGKPTRRPGRHLGRP